MHDGIEFEKHGIPAAVICTNEFINAARAMAEVAGLPGYPFAVVDHPVGSATDEERMEKARVALPQVLEILGNR